MTLTPLTEQERKQAFGFCTTLHDAFTDAVVDAFHTHERPLTDRVSHAAVATEALSLAAAWYAGDRASFMEMAAMAYDGFTRGDTTH